MSAEAPRAASSIYSEAASLLGGIPARRIDNPLDVHDALSEGLPGSALVHLVERLRVLAKSGKRLEGAVGVSLRTMQRNKGDAAKRLSPEQAGRAWQFAEILALATRALGSQEAAERWLEHPAIALDGRCPIDLLATPAGAKMVTELLGRIEYGVYT